MDLMCTSISTNNMISARLVKKIVLAKNVCTPILAIRFKTKTK